MLKSTRSRLWHFAPGIVIALMVAIALPACGPATPEPIDPAHLIGRWEMQTDEGAEWIDLKKNGDLSAELLSNGFIGTTIPAKPEARFRGTWTLDGDTLEILIDGAEGPLVYQITSLTNRTMTTVRSDGTHHTLHKGA